MTSAEERSQVLKRLAVEYCDVLRQLCGDSLVSVVLFGSVARGEATTLSDIDLLVVA
jgi:predicted nucleotidyltransferase